MITPNEIFSNEYSPLKINKEYELDETYQTVFPSETCVFASAYGNVLFCYCMN